jgi:TonB-dependent receptor
MNLLTFTWKLSLFRKILFVFLIFSISAFAQNGRIAGQITDYETGEGIIGCNILIEGTNLGAAADLDGKFVIPSVAPGKYNLIISSIGYSKSKITEVEVVSGQTITIKHSLKIESFETEEVIVAAKAVNSFEAALLNQRKNSNSISDGFSAEQIKKSPDATSSDALKRVTGISVMEGKYIFVRGTSERYSGALLNNTSLASTENEKRSFAFDLLPANLIENTVIDKSFTPDKPANYAGGIVNVNTVDFPSKLTLRVSVGSSYGSNTSFENFNTYNGGSKDFLGIDDGTRGLPDKFPANLNAERYSADEINNFAKLFKNEWKPTSTKAPLNNNFMISFGDGVTLLGENFGFVSGLSYKSGFELSNIERNEFEGSGEKRFAFKGTQSKFSTLWGGLFNFSYKFNGNHKISLKNTYSHSSDDEVSLLNGAQYSDAGTEQNQTAMRFISREVYSGQVFGEHFFQSLGGLKVDWNFSNSLSKKDEPDYRRITYARDLGTDDPFSAVLGFQPNLKNGGRFYSDMNEDTKGFATNFLLPVGSSKIKFGSLLETTNREFHSRLISVIINAPGNGYTDFNLLRLPQDEIFNPENFRKNGFSIAEYANGTNNYNADQDIYAAYMQAEIPFEVFGGDFRMIGGVRYENSIQNIKSRDLSDQKDIKIKLEKGDLLPAMNLIFKLNESSNLRLSFSQTINRPELRELAPFAYFDFATQTSVRGNENLKRAKINNFDFRGEIFPNLGEVLSAGFFYKEITDAIEKVVVTGSSLGSERTFLNSDNAKVYGVEIEGRFSLKYLTELLNDFSVGANASWIKSEVTVKSSETTVAREGRPLQGQSPYVFNFGLYYQNISSGTDISLLYNRIGERIIEVATAYDEDIIEKPRDILDLTLSQDISDFLNIKLSYKDILSQDQIFKQGSKLARLNSRESSLSAGISYKLN